jgi:uncharacterized membrane protein
MPLLARLLTGIGWGDDVEPATWNRWVAGGVLALALAVIFGKAIVLVLSGNWSARLAGGTGVLFFLGLGGLCAGPLGAALLDAWKVLRTVEFTDPGWLALLVLLPVIVGLGLRSLAGLGPVRRVLVITLCCLAVTFLTLVLAEPYLTYHSETVTVLFVVDYSNSVPEESDIKAGKRLDRRRQRLDDFIRAAVKQRGSARQHDRVGIIAFGKQPRLELPPAKVPHLDFVKLSDLGSRVDANYTDIAAAIKLALASFPEGTGKRIVLITDGHENLGNAEEQARLSQRNGAQIDVVPLALGQQRENEVLIQSIEAPTDVERAAQLPIKVLVRSYCPHTVVGTLTVKLSDEGQSIDVKGSPKVGVRLQHGINPFSFTYELTDKERSYTIEAEFQPEAVVDARGNVLHRGLPGDHVQNNRAGTHVVARGQRRILVVEARLPDAAGKWPHQFLIDQLGAAGKKKFQVQPYAAARLPKDRHRLGVFLSSFDCVILANVPADALSEAQQEVLASNTREQGCGLVMIGGPDSFGAGGWQKTPVEKALPVDCDIQSLKVQAKGGLVLIFHASEMPEGVFWQKKVAKLAIEKLAPLDMCGMIYYGGFGGHAWHIPFQTVGEDRARMLALVDQMAPGDMPDVDPALNLAHAALSDPKHELATRHIIFISDGDHWDAGQQAVARLVQDKITCSTVCITSHGQAEIDKMRKLAQATGGMDYAPRKADELPEIYTKESRLVSQSFVHETMFRPLLKFQAGPTEGLKDLQPLHGYVRTTRKSSPLVEVPIRTPLFEKTEQEFPILAYWSYGLGKTAAYTSDACQPPGKKFWAVEWAGSEMYGKFWEQLTDWVVRPMESRRLTMVTEYRDGRVKVIVEARDEQNGKSVPLDGLQLRAAVTTPAARAEDSRNLTVTMRQTNSGVYEGEFKAEEAGSYFITAQAVRKVPVKVRDPDGKEQVIEKEEAFDSVRSGVTVPYSPEFAETEKNAPQLLARLRELTGGIEYADNATALNEAARTGVLFRPCPQRTRSLQPVWQWLLFLTGLVLFLEVALRRLAFDPHKVATSAGQAWDRLRGRAPRPAAAYAMEPLPRHSTLVEAGEPSRAAQRFGGDEAAPAVAPPGAQEGTPAPARPSQPAAPSRVGPETAEDAGDAMSRLLKAKKRVWQEREKENE